MGSAASLATMIGLALSVADRGLAAASSGSPVSGTAAFAVRWLVEPGAESISATARPANVTGTAQVAIVPGAVYLLSTDPPGLARVIGKFPADPASSCSAVESQGRFAVASQDGAVSLWEQKDDRWTCRWTVELAERVASLTWDGGKHIYATTWRKRMHALNAATGRERWMIEQDGKVEAPGVIDGNRLFLVTKAKSLICLDVSGGTETWRMPLPGPVNQAPVLWKGRSPRLCCGTWDGHLLAYDPDNGGLLWTAHLPAKLLGGPAVAGGALVVCTADGFARGYDASGKQRWEAANACQGEAVITPAVLPNGSTRVIVVSRTLVALDAATGERRGDYPQGALADLKRRFEDAMLEGEKTYSEGEKQAAIEREAFDLGGAPFGSVAHSSESLVFGSEDGWCYQFDLATLRPVWRFHGAASNGTRPMLASGGFFVGNGEEVFAFDPARGALNWRRGLGGTVDQVGADEMHVAVLAGEHLASLLPADGSIVFRRPEEVRSFCLLGGSSPWVIADRQGNLSAVWPDGTSASEPSPLGGPLVGPAAIGGNGLLAATREGKLVEVQWEASPGSSRNGALTKKWETKLDESVARIDTNSGKWVLTLESGAIVCIESVSHQVSWRRSSFSRFEPHVFFSGDALIVCAGAGIRVYDLSSGEMRINRTTDERVIAADVSGGALRWWDRRGRHASVGNLNGEVHQDADLGLPLDSVTPFGTSVLFSTSAGDVGMADAPR